MNDTDTAETLRRRIIALEFAIKVERHRLVEISDDLATLRELRQHWCRGAEFAIEFIRGELVNSPFKEQDGGEPSRT